MAFLWPLGKKAENLFKISCFVVLPVNAVFNFWMYIGAANKHLPLKEFSPKHILYFIQFRSLFYPIFNIPTITAHIADNRYFSHKRYGCSVNVVSAGIAVRVVWNTDDIC